MKLDERTHVDRVWFVYDGQPRDWMATLYRQGDKPWEVEYRFRYYLDDKNTDEIEDEKRFFLVAGRDGSEESRVELVHAFGLASNALLETGFAQHREIVLVEGGIESFCTAMKKQPWAHFQSEKDTLPAGETP